MAFPTGDLPPVMVDKMVKATCVSHHRRMNERRDQMGGQVSHTMPGNQQDHSHNVAISEASDVDTTIIVRT